jgi:hypothetical protein
MNARAARTRGKNISLKDLDNIPMILYSRGSSTRTISTKRFGSAGCHYMPTTRKPLKNLLETGFGAPILPEKALRKSLCYEPSNSRRTAFP